MCVCLLLFYVLPISKVIEWVPTSDSAHSWWLYSAAPLWNQTTSTMNWYPTQSHCPDTEPTSPCPILTMQSNWFSSDRFKSCHWFDSTRVWTQGFESHDLPKWETDAQLIWPFHLVYAIMMHTYMYIYIYIYVHIWTYNSIYSKTSLNRRTMGPTLNDPVREVVGLGSYNIVIGDRLGPSI